MFSYPNLSGYWNYGIHKSPEFLVKISGVDKIIQMEFVFRDWQTGDEIVLGRGRALFLSFYELMVEGKWVRSHKLTKKGAKFRLRWLLFDNNKKIQEIAYWGVYRQTSYLLKSP